MKRAERHGSQTGSWVQLNSGKTDWQTQCKKLNGSLSMFTLAEEKMPMRRGVEVVGFAMLVTC